MTTLIAWCAHSKTTLQPNLPRALFVAADSRITWGSGAKRWDAGRKVFTTTHEAHLFGYCGDVVFPSLILSQLASAIDRNLLFHNSASPTEKHQIILEAIKDSFSNRQNAPNASFSIVHAYRHSTWPNTSFHLWQIDYDAKSRTWSNQSVTIPTETSLVIALGSGASMTQMMNREFNQSEAHGLSRSIYQAFCESIQHASNSLSGGVPQIAALNTAKPAQVFGYVRKKVCYLHGMKIPIGPKLKNIEWVDDLFQRINPTTMKPIEGSRRFISPKAPTRYKGHLV